jgi:hypothetical protein
LSIRVPFKVTNGINDHGFLEAKPTNSSLKKTMKGVGNFLCICQGTLLLSSPRSDIPQPDLVSKMIWEKVEFKKEKF